MKSNKEHWELIASGRGLFILKLTDNEGGGQLTITPEELDELRSFLSTLPYDVKELSK